MGLRLQRFPMSENPPCLNYVTPRHEVIMGRGRWGSHGVSCELGRQPLYFFQGTGLKIEERSVLLWFFFIFKNVLWKTLTMYPHSTRLEKTPVFTNASLSSNSIVLNIHFPPQSLRWCVFKLHVHLPSRKLENWEKICHWDMSVSKDRKRLGEEPNFETGDQRLAKHF